LIRVTRISIRVTLINPCTLLSADVVHVDLVDLTKAKCNELYETYFLEEISEMCPVLYGNGYSGDPHYQIKKTRTKRFVMVGAVVLSAIVVVGLGITGVAVAATNKVEISNQRTKLDLQQKSLDFVSEQTNFTEIAVRKLRQDINILADETRIHEADFEEVKMKSPGTNYAISYITTRFVLGKQIIKEATKKWRNHELYPGLMDFLNMTLPCGLSCPLNLAVPKGCNLSPDQKDLHIDLDVPTVNQEVTFVEADPFDLFMQTENKTCKINYTGPKNAILSNKDGCPLAMNIKCTRMYDLIISPHQTCLNNTKTKDGGSYFSISQCYPRGSRDHEDFVQIKPHHGSLHVYCYGSNITIDGHEQDCPEGVFILPLSAAFQINGQEFTGSTVQLENLETPDPLFTMRTNWYLKPRVDYKKLMDDPLIHNNPVFRKGEQTQTLGLGFYAFSILTCITAILIFIIVKCYFENRKIKVRLVTKPRLITNEKVMPDEHELQEFA